MIQRYDVNFEIRGGSIDETEAGDWMKVEDVEKLDAEFAGKLLCLNDGQEQDHIKADELLIELLKLLGLEKTASAFDEVDKWYS